MKPARAWKFADGYALWIGNERFVPIHAEKRGRIGMFKAEKDARLAAGMHQALYLLAAGKCRGADGVVWEGFDKDDVMRFAARVLAGLP